MRLPNSKALILVLWFTSSLIITGTTLFYLTSRHSKKEEPLYSVFEAKPPLEITAEDSISGSDSRAAIVDQYFAKHKCPMAGTGQKMVEVADKYGFDYWWLPAIAWQESTCGKVMPHDSYNAWGYGIYGTKVTRFESWDQAIETIARDLSKNYFNKGLVEPCDVMKRYTPPSKGSWCKGIIYFRDEMLAHKTPDTGRHAKNIEEYYDQKAALEEAEEVKAIINKGEVAGASTVKETTSTVKPQD